MHRGRLIQLQSNYRFNIYAKIEKKCALGFESCCWWLRVSMTQGRWLAARATCCIRAVPEHCSQFARTVKRCEAL
jgi:hypothetical protein